MEHLRVILPVYNEQDIILEVIASWLKVLRSLDIRFKIYVYDDGSKDGTLDILNSVSKNNPEIVIKTGLNIGHGPTILKGYRESGEATWIFQTDSDNEMPASSFETLWRQRDGYDFIIGKRQGRSQKIPRKVVSLVSRVIVWSFYFPCGVLDVNCPYRLMRADCFKDVFSSIPENTFAPNVIVSGMAGLKRMKIFQINVSHTGRTTGVYSLNIKKLIKCSALSMIQTVFYRFRII